MPVLEDLAELLADKAEIQVHEAALLFASEDGLPRARLSKPGITRHAIFRGPAGLYFCDLRAPYEQNFYAQIAAGEVEVGELIKLDPAEEIVIENNWPSSKVEVAGRYYAVPRNFAPQLHELLVAARKKRRRS